METLLGDWHDVDEPSDPGRCRENTGTWLLAGLIE